MTSLMQSLVRDIKDRILWQHCFLSVEDVSVICPFAYSFIPGALASGFICR